MAVMLFKLRGAEEDEADEIRALLEEQDIDFYETNNGRWGLGFAAIWLHHNDELNKGKKLIASYQKQRSQAAREAYAQLCQDGKQPTILDVAKVRPLQVLLVLLGVLFMALLSMLPFVFL